MRSPSRKRTLRTRLTLLYAGAAAIVGSGVVAVTYGFVAATIESQPLDTVALALPSVEVSSSTSVETGSPPEDVTEVNVTLEEVAVAVTSLNVESRAEVLASLLRLSVVTLVIAVTAAALVGWAVAGRAVRPLRQITSTARAVADDNLDRRIAMTGPRDEITELADTFDAMLERLHASFEGQRRFVAHASHELRTPLTINRTVLEVALSDPEVPAQTRELAEELLPVNARHEHLIDGLLTLATAEGAALQTGEADIADAARAALRSVAHEIADKRLLVEQHLEPAPLRGDPVLLERLVHNLLENAVRYNDPGGFVSVRTGTIDGTAELEVTNSGAVVPGDAVGSLFEPFHRLGRDGTQRHRREGYVRGGVGLGLAVVSAVAVAHGGTVEALARPSGGLVVRVRLTGATSAASSPPAA